MAENQTLNSAGTQGLSSPFADAGNTGEMSSPFSDASQPEQQNAGVWDTIKSNMGARVDATAAALLQDTGSDKSRYALQRAQRSSQEARLKENSLSGWQRTGVQAADIGTGLALSAAGTAIGGPAVGATLGGAYFGGESATDQLRHDADETGRYDLTKATGLGVAQGIAGEFTGGLANKAVGAAAPVVGQAINRVSSAVLPTAGKVAGAVAKGVSEPLGYLGGKGIGQTIGKYTGKAVDSTVVAGSDFVGNKALPALTDLATHVVTSKGGQAVTGGAATGSAMQMISNVANGRPVTENVKEAAEGGAIAGGVIHGASPVVGGIAKRLPTTLSIAKNNVLGNRGRYEGPTEEAPAPTGPEPMPQSPTGGEGALSPEGSAPKGSIPMQELHAPFAEGEAVPGMGEFNPSDYGQGPQGAWRNVQPGQGIGGGPRMGGPASVLDNVPGGGAAKDAVSALYHGFQDAGLLNVFSRSGARDAARAERTHGVENIPENKELINDSKKTTAVLDVQHQLLANAEPGSPEYNNLVDSINNVSLNSGGAAAETLANQVALDVGIPMTAQYHNRTVHAGVANEGNPMNPALKAGYTKEQIKKEHNALMDAENLSVPGFGERNATDVEQGLTHEAHFNKTQQGYSKAHQRMVNSMDDNLKLTGETETYLANTGKNEESRRAAELHDDMKELNGIMTQVSNGKPVNEKIKVLNRRIVDNANYLNLYGKLKNINGEAGTFNPAINAQAWHSINEGTRMMHSQAPKGSYKEQAKEAGIGLMNVNFAQPGTFIKPITKVVNKEINRDLSIATQAKGAAIARKNSIRPEATDETLNALRNGDTEGAANAAASELEAQGTSTEGPTLAATPAQEIAAQDNNTAVNEPATAAQHAELGRRGHWAAGNEMSRSEAELFLNHDNMVRQGQAEAGGVPPSPETAAAMASQPASAAPEAIAEPQAAEATPVEEVAPQAAPEAPTGPGSFAQNNTTPSRIAEPTVEPEPAPAPVEKVSEVKPTKLAEPTPEETARLDELTDKMENDPRGLTEGESAEMSELSDKHLTPPAEKVSEVKPAKLGEAKVAEEAPKAEPNNQKPARLKEKAEEVKTEEEAKPKEATPVSEEKPAEEITPADMDTHSISEKVDTKATDRREDESYSDRNKRVAKMAKRLVMSKVEKVLKAPAAKATLKEKVEARQLEKGITQALEIAKAKADNENVHYADVLAAVMNQEGGINTLFRKGYGTNEITGRINEAVKQYRAKQRDFAKAGLDEAGEIVKRHLSEVGATRESRDKRITDDLMAAGYSEGLIKKAFASAEERSPGSYTMRQVKDWARTHRKTEAAKPGATPGKQAPKPMQQTKAGFSKWINNLGADMQTKIALQKIVENHTKEGTGESGVRGPLSDKQFDAVMKDLHNELLDRAQNASKAAKDAIPGPQKERAIKRDQTLSEAVKTAQQTEGSAKAGNDEILGAHAAELKRKAAEEQRVKDEAAKDRETEERAEEATKAHEEKVKAAEKAAEEEIHEKAKEMNDEEVRQFGSVVTEEMPTSFDGRGDPKYTAWSASAKEAVKQLRARGDEKEANFIEHFHRVIDTGLKRLEELPDRKDLTMSSEDYEQLRHMYINLKKGEGEALGTGESLGTQMGTTGIRIRTLLQGHSGAIRKLYNARELKQEREKALFNKNNENGDDLNTAGIVAKPKKTEPVSTPEPKAKVEKPVKTETEIAYSKQKTKVANMVRKLNNDDYWAKVDDGYGRKWKAHKSATEFEKSKLAKMPKK